MPLLSLQLRLRHLQRGRGGRGTSVERFETQEQRNSFSTILSDPASAWRFCARLVRRNCSLHPMNIPTPSATTLQTPISDKTFPRPHTVAKDSSLPLMRIDGARLQLIQRICDIPPYIFIDRPTFRLTPETPYPATSVYNRISSTKEDTSHISHTMGAIKTTPAQHV